MTESIMHEYKQVKDIKIYTKTDVLIEFKNKSWPKSSIIKPVISGSENEPQLINIEGSPATNAPADTAIRNELETFFDTRDSQLVKHGFEPISFPNEDTEAGNILIIVDLKE